MATWVIIGCGYTGSALVRRLVAQGEDVILTRRTAEAAATTAAAVGGKPRVLDPSGPGVATLVASEGAIIVCCAPPGPEPRREIERLIALTPRRGRLVYVSSTGVYPPAAGAWVDESWPLEPVTAAGRARVIAESALPADAVILRAAGIHGPGRGLGSRIQAGTYRIVGDGSAHVSRIHVDDLVEAILRAGAGTVTGAINIADDDPAPIGELADAVAASLGLPAPPRVPASSVDPEVAGMLGAGSPDRERKRMKRELGVVLRYPSGRATG